MSGQPSPPALEHPAAGVARDDAAAAAAAAAAAGGQGVLIIACGALAHEVIALKRLNRWDYLEVRCLPAELHNRPERIPASVRALIRASRCHYRSIFVAYADCGTGGALDAVLAEEGIERIPGAHCYEFFATSPVFAALSEAEVGTFYLTDFLLRHFERLVIRGLKLDTHPELFDSYFGNYRRLVYLAQAHPETAAVESARAIAARMGLLFEMRETGYGDLARSLEAAVAGNAAGVLSGRPSTRSAREEVITWHR